MRRLPTFGIWPMRGLNQRGPCVSISVPSPRTPAVVRRHAKGGAMDVDAESEQGVQPEALSNAEIADRLASLAQLLSTQTENRNKVKAYRRAATRIRTLAESLHDMVRDEADLTRFVGIGEGIAAAIREIVVTGTLSKLEKLRGEATPAVAGISA